MTKEIEFYYDIVSPYTYLAYKRIIEIEKTSNIKFIYKPILLGGLHKLSNITAAAFIESKKKYTMHDCQLIAEKFKINFKYNDKFPISSLNIMRGVLTLEENKKKNYIDKFFNAYWCYNIDLSDEKEIIKILNSLQIDYNEYILKVKDQKTKDLLKNLTNEAFKKEVFGAPTFIVNGKIYWGQDRLDFAIDEYNKITQS
tara:strand:+ start:69 stop:665 length:597 start_codon:yes stop_codon:yes gene_type:complete